MDKRKLLKLIQIGESEKNEFKESLSVWKEIIKSISAFANTEGGTVLVGVTDSGKIKGLQVGKKTLEDLANKIKENTDPKNYPKIGMEEINQKNIIIIEIEENKSKPVFAFDKVYKRVGKTNQRVNSEEIRKLAKESESTYWDGWICREAVLEDIDEKIVEKFLKKAENKRNLDINSNVSIREVLERLGLIKDKKITNAAILLFGSNSQKFFSQAEIRCARFKGIEPLEFIDIKVFGGNIINQRDDAIKFVKEHIKLHAKVVGTERIEEWEYPIEAIREAITNAICHRDYEILSSIQVRIFDDRIEIWGCGLLPKPLTPDDLRKKHKSILRNPLIARCFFLIKFIEEWGTGTNRIIKECLKYDLPEPVFEEVAGSLIVTFGKSKLTEEYLEEMELNERQKKAIKYLREYKRITSSKYAELFKITERMARNDLRELAVKKVIKKMGVSDKTTRYNLAEI